MGELVSEGTSFSCSRCSSKLKISVPASLAESESKKLANTGNYVFLPPGGMCSATQSLCTPSISTTDPGQTVVQIDGKMALGAGCKLECSKGGPLMVDSPGQTTSTHESTLHKVLEGVAAAAAVAALFIPVVGEVEVGVGAAAEVGAMEAAEGASAIEASEAAEGSHYSIAFETKLSPNSYPGVSRAGHFQEANLALLKAIEEDPQCAQTMQRLGIKLERTPTGLAPRTSPEGWTWHHAQEPGVMQLVPRSQHQPGSIFQDALHPGGKGGYSIWGQ